MEIIAKYYALDVESIKKIYVPFYALYIGEKLVIISEQHNTEKVKNKIAECEN